ncbi:hypothetical protein [Desulfonema magnum]|uniref:Polymerase domain-containing protein n=1 Tax=Desulfonema magnum TaxID=45655 RepID=A0A975BFL8_9BACT|nr:hypothetical protein [Desulfonema magnum]QTA84844.1 polymerase domain-containing protein [Desulfonema magnum]
MMKKPSSKDTKAQILTAYKELDQAYRQLLKEKRTQDPDASPEKPVRTAAETEKDADTAEMKGVIESLEHLAETFNTAVSRLSGDLLVEASRLKDARSQVETETDRLSRLYDLEIGEDSLRDLLRQYTEAEKSCEKGLEEKRESLEKELAEKKHAWDEEEAETIRQMKEQKASDKKDREREVSEYRYTLALNRDADAEEYDRQKKALEQALEELREIRHAEWEEREKQISERENQFEEYKQKVENFPKELENAIKKAKEEGNGIARKQSKIRAELRAKEINGEHAVYELKIQGLEADIVEQAARIESLSQQLEIATGQAQELAVKAIEGASGQTSFRELKELAMEQAKNPVKGK